MKQRGRRFRHSGICAGCGELIPHTDRFSPKYWDLGERGELPPDQFEGMLIAVAVALECTREEAVQTVGSAAHNEGKSFDESLLAYFWLYTDGVIPRVEGYGGRVACRGIPKSVISDCVKQTGQSAPNCQAETVQGRIQSRGTH